VKDVPYRAFRSFPIASAPMKWRCIHSTTGTTRGQHRTAADLPAIRFTLFFETAEVFRGNHAYSILEISQA
jgi:hypothetical protein